MGYPTGYPTWDDMGSRYGMGKPPPLDTIPFKRYGFGLFVEYPICRALTGISRGMVSLWHIPRHGISHGRCGIYVGCSQNIRKFLDL